MACKSGDTQIIDACNTCKCDDSGTWRCTKLDCGAPPAGLMCKPGEIKGADCNTCTCNGAGQWECTKLNCPPVSYKCEMQPEVSCEKGFVYGLDPATGTCCYYDFACQVPVKWQSFSSLTECAKAVQ